MAYTVIITDKKVLSWTDNPAYIANATITDGDTLTEFVLTNADQQYGLALATDFTSGYPDLAMLQFAKTVIENLIAELSAP